MIASSLFTLSANSICPNGSTMFGEVGGDPRGDAMLLPGDTNDWL